MKKIRPLFGACMLVCFISQHLRAQSTIIRPDSSMSVYRAAAPRINDLLTTRLNVSFDYQKHYLHGEEWLTARAHASPVNELQLNAKGMDINAVLLLAGSKRVPLNYTYRDSLKLYITLDRTYSDKESYTIYIAYTAKPEKAKRNYYSPDEHGLYFINSDSTIKNKPVEIWTHGESDNSSYWFPTIDQPNQKTAEEINMTVPARYITLSNGRMIAQKLNRDGTRTDTWKMDLPNAPYLFMMAVGDFKVYHDKWGKIPVDYYLEPKYAPFARNIFGITPEAIGFYSKILGVDFPWNKYAQVVLRDYPSGATENTTATSLGESVQATARELLDSYYGEGERTIVHELFHQWFGDDVTCSSWSNLTLNESFARFGEILWAEHKYGADAAGDALNTYRLNYLNTPNADKENLVRFYYHDQKEMFDVVSYEKGATILYMLRNYLGNEAFYSGLRNYLKTYAYKNADVQGLRLALESSSGLDLNWFFNEWYYGAGHPILKIDYHWDPLNHKETVYIDQLQAGKPFQMPLAIDIYAGGIKTRHNVWIRSRKDTLVLSSQTKPDLVNVDADKMLLSQKTDNKTITEYNYQYFHAPLYIDRKEAVNAAAKDPDNKKARQILTAALLDTYYGIKISAIRAISKDSALLAEALPRIKDLAAKERNNLVRATALNALSGLKSSENLELFESAMNAQSYAVSAAGLEGYAALRPAEGLARAHQLELEPTDRIAAIISVYANYGNDHEWPFVHNTFSGLSLGEKFNSLTNYALMTGRVQSTVFAKEGITQLTYIAVNFRQTGVTPVIVDMLKTIRKQRAALHDDEGSKAAQQAIDSIH